jgi:signal peptidase I
MKKEEIKKYWKKFWYVIWEDPSLKGWIISIIFLFVFTKFIFFPSLSLITGSALPMAIVESCSMYHQGDIFSNYEKWWERHETKYTSLSITKEQLKKFKFSNGFNKGDILFIIEAKPEKVQIGDVVIFETGRKNPLIHRVINIQEKEGKYIFSTIGDNNWGQLESEKIISEDQLVGKAVFKIAPFIGWGKLIFFELTRSDSERGFCEEN